MTVTRKEKFDLANRILLDKSLSASVRLVGWYITDHIHTERGFAWPPQEQIAADLGIDERTVRRAVKELTPHLAIDRSQRQHEYRMATPDNLSAIKPSDTGHFCSDTGQKCTSIPDKNVPPSLEHPLTSSKEEPTGAKKGKPRKQGTEGREGRGQPRKQEIPTGWTPNQQSIQNGENLGFSHAEISREAEKFRNHARQNAREAVRWDAAFDNWLIKAAEFMGRSPRSNGSVASAALVSLRPFSPQWEAWRAFHAAKEDELKSKSWLTIMAYKEEANLSLHFDSEWPPGYEAQQAAG
jgi:Helix-turn-helix domain